MSDRDSLGDRMKQRYEDRARVLLPRRTYTIIRVDGKAFHSFTRHCEKPFDARLAESLDYAAVALCREAQGARLAYIQSDEISVLLTDFAIPTTEAWFDGNLQKICSVAASTVTAAFNADYANDGDIALFDARVFVIPDPVEVENYFIWRQKDAERNSLASLCQQYYSAKQLHSKGAAEQHDLLHAKSVNWNDLEPYWKRGRVAAYYEAAGWRISDAPIFTQDRAWLSAHVPRQWAESATPVDRGTPAAAGTRALAITAGNSLKKSGLGCQSGCSRSFVGARAVGCSFNRFAGCSFGRCRSPLSE